MEPCFHLTVPLPEAPTYVCEQNSLQVMSWDLLPWPENMAQENILGLELKSFWLWIYWYVGWMKTGPKYKKGGGSKEKQNLRAEGSLKFLLYIRLKHLFGKAKCLNDPQKERRSILSSIMYARPCAKHSTRDYIYLCHNLMRKIISVYPFLTCKGSKAQRSYITCLRIYTC